MLYERLRAVVQAAGVREPSELPPAASKAFQKVLQAACLPPPPKLPKAAAAAQKAAYAAFRAAASDSALSDAERGKLKDQIVGGGTP